MGNSEMVYGRGVILNRMAELGLTGVGTNRVKT